MVAHIIYNTLRLTSSPFLTNLIADAYQNDTVMDIAVFSSYLDNISVDVCSNEFCEYLPKCGAPEFLRLNQSFHYRDYISRNPVYCQ